MVSHDEKSASPPTTMQKKRRDFVSALVRSGDFSPEEAEAIAEKIYTPPSFDGWVRFRERAVRFFKKLSGFFSRK